MKLLKAVCRDERRYPWYKGTNSSLYKCVCRTVPSPHISR